MQGVREVALHQEGDCDSSRTSGVFNKPSVLACLCHCHVTTQCNQRSNTQQPIANLGPQLTNNADGKPTRVTFVQRPEARGGAPWNSHGNFVTQAGEGDSPSNPPPKALPNSLAPPDMNTAV